MNINNFIFVGKIASLRTISSAHLRIVLSEVGPKKVNASADIRDGELITLLTKPGGFGVGDIVCLQGMCILDPLSGMNIALVNKTGASRIAAAASPAVATVRPLVAAGSKSFPLEHTVRPRHQTPTSASSAEGVTAPADARWPRASDGYDDDIPFAPLGARNAFFTV